MATARIDSGNVVPSFGASELVYRFERTPTGTRVVETTLETPNAHRDGSL